MGHGTTVLHFVGEDVCVYICVCAGVRLGCGRTQHTHTHTHAQKISVIVQRGFMYLIVCGFGGLPFECVSFLFFSFFFLGVFVSVCVCLCLPFR